MSQVQDIPLKQYAQIDQEPQFVPEAIHLIQGLLSGFDLIEGDSRQFDDSQAERIPSPSRISAQEICRLQAGHISIDRVDVQSKPRGEFAQAEVRPSLGET
jgi:hypothetical protein